MGRFDQRLKKRLKKPEFAAGYAEMDVQIALLRALDRMRERMHISKSTLAKRLGKARPSLARLFSAAEANPTIGTITDICAALGIQAHIQLRKAGAKRPLITVEEHL